MPKLREATTVKQRTTGIIHEFTTDHLYKLLSDAKLRNPYTCVFRLRQRTTPNLPSLTLRAIDD
jgi:hypothetical protein